MPILIFVEHDGAQHQVEAAVGESVMQAAANARVRGILADCGGSGACGTCHAYIGAAWRDLLPAPAPNEREMLACVLDPREESRLTCRLTVTEELDHMVIQLPRSQI